MDYTKMHEQERSQEDTCLKFHVYVACFESLLEYMDLMAELEFGVVDKWYKPKCK